MCCGSVNGMPVSTICRDTGWSSVIISDAVLPHVEPVDDKNIDVYEYLGRMDTFPVVRCYLRCAYYDGYVDTIRAPIKFCSVLIGNIPGASDHTNPNNQSVSVNAVTTRSSSIKSSPIHPLVLAKLDQIKIDSNQFRNIKQTCASLAKVRKLADENSCITMRDGSEYKFVVDDNLLYRRCIKSNSSRMLG